MFNVRSCMTSVQTLWRISTSLILIASSWPERLSHSNTSSPVFLAFFSLFSPNISPNLTNMKYFVLCFGFVLSSGSFLFGIITCIGYWAQWRVERTNQREQHVTMTLANCQGVWQKLHLSFTSSCLRLLTHKMRTKNVGISVYGSQLTARQTVVIYAHYFVLCCYTLVYKYIILLFCMYIHFIYLHIYLLLHTIVITFELQLRIKQ